MGDIEIAQQPSGNMLGNPSLEESTGPVTGYLIVKQRLKDLQGIMIPVLWWVVQDADGNVSISEYKPLIRLFRENSDSSLTSKRYITRGVALFLTYVDCRYPGLDSRVRTMRKAEIRQIFKEFCLHIRFGTGPSNGVAESYSDLGWLPKSRNVTVGLINGLQTFLNFMFDNMDLPASAAEKLGLPTSDRNFSKEYTRTFNMLGHLKMSPPRRAIALGAGVVRRDPHDVYRAYSSRFPMSLMVDFITEGDLTVEEIEESRWCTTGMLQRAILAASGMRASESLQAWLGDITLDDDGNLVGFLRHPSHFVQKGGDKPLNRKAFLLKNYGLHVRRSGHGRLAAGFKSVKMDSGFSTQIYWAPYPGLKSISQSYCFII